MAGERDLKWVRETRFPDLPVRSALNDPSLQWAASLAGMGMTVLPCHFVDPYLERRSEPMPSYDIWVLVHPDLRRSPRLRVFRDEMVAALKRLQPTLAGRP